MARNLNRRPARLWSLAAALAVLWGGQATAQNAQPGLQGPVNLLAPPPRGPVVPQTALPDFLRGPAFVPQAAGPLEQEAAGEPPSPLTGTLQAPAVHSLNPPARSVPLQSHKPGEAVGR